jgi:two-component system, NarL family, nitrate/nitrite sensor histidine kinase NarX
MKIIKNYFPNVFKSTNVKVILMALAFCVILTTGIIDHYRPGGLSLSVRLTINLLALSLIAYIVVGLRSHEKKELTEQSFRVDQLEQRLSVIQKHLHIVIQFSRNLVDAKDEGEMIEQLLQLGLDVTGADGATFVPFDEPEQPKAAISRGKLPASILNPWAEQLALSHARQRCEACNRHNAGTGEECPLIDASIYLQYPEIKQVYCKTLWCSTHKVGMITFYFGSGLTMSSDVEYFLRAILDETALGLESVRLRKKETSALQQIQLIRQKTDMEGLVSSLLDHVQQTLEADFAVLLLNSLGRDGKRLAIHKGYVNNQMNTFLEGLLQSVIVSGDPVLMSDISIHTPSVKDVHTLIAVPLVTQNNTPIGGLLIGTVNPSVYLRRHLDLLQTLAGHLALVINNASLMSELEYKTMLDERTRLAREIHDGLAQTLGFLKMQVAQLQNYLIRGEYERLNKGLQTSYHTLADAYIEVREVIDGLRTNPSDENIQIWLKELADDFASSSGIQIESTSCGLLAELPKEIQIQLIRIIQEALSNVRKHAQATRVEILCNQSLNEFILEISDNGLGFTPEEVTSAAQYGLRGMRERAELMGGDFQIISNPGNGTRIRLSILVPSKEAG